MKEAKFYVCETCGNLVGMINESGVNMVCCGKKMTKLEPGTVEASHEKHIPVVNVDGNIVKVEIGSVAHPMTEEHSIQWVYLQTDRGCQRKCLKIGDEPIVTFAISNEKVTQSLEGKQVVKTIYIPSRLVNIVVK